MCIFYSILCAGLFEIALQIKLWLSSAPFIYVMDFLEYKSKLD